MELIFWKEMTKMLLYIYIKVAKCWYASWWALALRYNFRSIRSNKCKNNIISNNKIGFLFQAMNVLLRLTMIQSMITTTTMQRMLSDDVTALQFIRHLVTVWFRMFSYLPIYFNAVCLFYSFEKRSRVEQLQRQRHLNSSRLLVLNLYSLLLFCVFFKLHLILFHFLKKNLFKLQNVFGLYL